ncbi:MAG: aspartate aminotransferase family protein, partial [Candidatus Methylacidiphilales bacterium]
IKLARKWGSSSGRFEIITTEGSFHGRTMAGISATGQDKVKVGFEPLLPGFVHVPFNDLSAVAAALTDRTAAVLVEGIQGEGGVIEARPDYLMGLREITRKAGCLLLWDGVQCGGFRCGDFQSYTRILAGQMGADTFLPDGIAMAKSLGSGFPIGATWIREPYAGVLGPGSHGSTYGGNALACAVACAVLDEIETKHWGSHIIQIGDELKKRLRRDLGNGVVAVRGCGGLIGVEVKGDMPALRMKLLDHGLLLAPAARNTLRWLPPLNVRWEDVEEALAIWNQCL